MTPREVRRLWAEALESGEFKQGQGCLKEKNFERYCCLGVLCVMADRAGVQSGWREDDTHPPRKVREWAGLVDVGGNFDNSSLVDLNDDGMSFDEIAAIIRAEPDGLFEREPA